MKAKKLILILDLDHTLLHASQFCSKEDLSQHEDIYEIFLTIGIRKQVHYVKARPGLTQFLEEIAPKFEMYVYTHGTREYALEVLRHLDPKRKFVADRVLTRSDKQHYSKKLSKDLTNLFPADDSMVLIVDDRKDVWSENSDNLQNLITVKPYRYFKYNAKTQINNESGPMFPALASVQTGKDNDKVLKHLQGLLTWIHNRFFLQMQSEQGKANVKDVVRELRQRILRKQRVFVESALLLVNDSELSRTKKLVVELGGIVVSGAANLHACTQVLISKEIAKSAAPSTTVDNNGNHDDANPVVVSIDWLWSSAHNWWKESEQSFRINLPHSKLLELCGSTATTSSSEDDDVDQLTAFIET